MAQVIIPGIDRVIAIDAASQTTGSGLDDATSGGTYTGTNRSVYTMEITATGTPDTIRWRENETDWVSGISITGSAQTLNKGVTVTFGATTGHTLNDVWTIEVQGDLTIDRSQTDEELSKYVVVVDRILTAILLRKVTYHLYEGTVTILADTANDTTVLIDESGTGESELFVDLATLKTSEQAKLDAQLIADAPPLPDSPVDGV